MLQRKETTAASANPCSAMESGNHSKNGASLKSLMSKGKLLTVLSVLFLAVVMGACKGGGDDDDDDYSEPEPLTAPTGVTATQIGGQIKVSWDPVKGADTYDVLCEYRHFAYIGGNSYYVYSLNENTNIQDCYFLFTPSESSVDTCLFRVRACRNDFYCGYNDWSETVSCVYVYPGGGSETGLYMGIIGFNEEIDEKRINLLTDYKNTYNTNSFTSFVNEMSMKDATGIYYAVDNAIKRLEIAELPNDLENVSIVTFTDGIDNTSLELNSEYKTKEAYRNAIKKRITNTKIKELPINAYSIGLRGGDISDVETFRTEITAMASHDTCVYELVDMNDVYETFRKLAASLYNESQSRKVKLKINGGCDDGTKIRFTWDCADANHVTDSKYYIEGIYRRNGDERTLENVVYKGISSSSGTIITGERNSTDKKIAFTFNDIIECGFDSQDIMQYTYLPSGKWQKDSEFGQKGDIEPIVDKKSAVVMLVLDCTTSLGSDDFRRMKNAATDFIKILTNK